MITAWYMFDVLSHLKSKSEHRDGSIVVTFMHISVIETLSSGIPAKEGSSFLRLKIMGIYRIPCECGTMYIAQTRFSIRIMLNQRDCHIWLYQQEKATECSINLGLCSMLRNSSILNRRLDKGAVVWGGGKGMRSMLMKWREMCSSITGFGSFVILTFLTHLRRILWLCSSVL
jgi:hypothetical protein